MVRLSKVLIVAPLVLISSISFAQTNKSIFSLNITGITTNQKIENNFRTLNEKFVFQKNKLLLDSLSYKKDSISAYFKNQKYASYIKNYNTENLIGGIKVSNENSLNKSSIKKEVAHKTITRKIKKLIAPSNSFDLSDWSLSVPIDQDNNRRADNVEEKTLNNGYVNEYFYATENGAMVFKCPIGGVKTSTNTTYTRTELREMLRAGNTSIKTKGPNKNNWVLKSSRSSKNAAGYDGQLNATLAINKVTTTGNSSQVGRVVIGQIHAKNNEPIRLYYRKLPNNNKGSVYFAHENNITGKEEYYELIGKKSNLTENPIDGISLDEKFSYVINLDGNELSVKISRPDKPTVEHVINIKKSGYNDREEYMYFKAGVYNQNKSGDPLDYVQATFYELSNSHNSRQIEDSSIVAYNLKK